MARYTSPFTHYIFSRLTSIGKIEVGPVGSRVTVAGADGALYHKGASLDGGQASMSIGAFHSTTAGSGTPIDEVTTTAAFRVYVDDAGVALTPTGSVGDLRGSISRFLVTADQSAIHARVWGLMGQAKVYNTLFSEEQIGGLCGRFELVQASATTTLGGYGMTGAVTGIFATAGTTTVDTNHIAAAVLAMADIKGTCTQTGKVCGVAVTKYNTSQWSDSTSRAAFTYGMYISDDSCSTGLYVGQTGDGNAIVLGGNGRISTSTAAGASLGIDATSHRYGEGLELRYHIADWADSYTITDGTGMYLRMENREANSNGSIYGCQVYGVSNDVANTKYLWGGIFYAYVKGAAGLTATGVYALQPEISFDAETASSTIDELCVVRGKVTGGTLADYTKLHGYKLIAGDMNGGSRTYGNAFWVIDDADMSGSCIWTRILHAEGKVALRGVQIGTYSSTANNAPAINGATYINAFCSDDAGVAQTASTVCRNLLARTMFTVDQTSAAADYSVIRGHLKAASGVDFSGDTSVKAAIWGYSEFAGATIIGAGSFYASVLGEFWGDGNITGTGLAGAVMARIYTSTGTVSGTVAGLTVCKHFASTQTFTHGVYIQDGSVATGMDIRLQGGATISSGSAAPTHSATQGSIYLRTGQATNATLYINSDGGTTWALCNALT